MITPKMQSIGLKYINLFCRFLCLYPTEQQRLNGGEYWGQSRGVAPLTRQPSRWSVFFKSVTNSMKTTFNEAKSKIQTTTPVQEPQCISLQLLTQLRFEELLYFLISFLVWMFLGVWLGYRAVSLEQNESFTHESPCSTVVVMATPHTAPPPSSRRPAPRPPPWPCCPGTPPQSSCPPLWPLWHSSVAPSVSGCGASYGPCLSSSGPAEWCARGWGLHSGTERPVLWTGLWWGQWRWRISWQEGQCFGLMRCTVPALEALHTGHCWRRRGDRLWTSLGQWSIRPCQGVWMGSQGHCWFEIHRSLVALLPLG